MVFLTTGIRRIHKKSLAEILIRKHQLLRTESHIESGGKLQRILISPSICHLSSHFIVENIENNRYGYTLEQSTISKKGSDIPLVDTHQLVDAIYREGTTVSVEDSSRDDSPLTNLELAIVHEYGVKDKHIPARPIWRETFKDFKETARGRITSFLDDPKFKR